MIQSPTQSPPRHRAPTRQKTPPRHWAEDLIGIPWVSGGTGAPAGADPTQPDIATWGFDCREMFRWVQTHIYHRSVPYMSDADATSELQVQRAFRTLIGVSGWAETSQPTDGDGVIMGPGKGADHIGVWLAIDGGGVLHCPRGHGVGFHSAAMLAVQGFKILGYYTPPEGAPDAA